MTANNIVFILPPENYITLFSALSESGDNLNCSGNYTTSKGVYVIL
jgi:hypothetical protein